MKYPQTGRLGAMLSFQAPELAIQLRCHPIVQRIEQIWRSAFSLVPMMEKWWK